MKSPKNGAIGNIVLIIIYYSIITPVGLFMKLCGRDKLKLKKSTVSSFWSNKGM